MKFGYQTNTWGGVVGHPAGVTSIKVLFYLTYGSDERALRDIAAAGYAGFEIFDGNLQRYADDPTSLKRSMDETDLTLIAVYRGWSPNQTDQNRARAEPANLWSTENLCGAGGQGHAMWQEAGCSTGARSWDRGLPLSSTTTVGTALAPRALTSTPTGHANGDAASVPIRQPLASRPAI